MIKVKKLAVYSTIGALVMTNLIGCLCKRKEEATAEIRNISRIERPQTEEEIFSSNSALEQLQEHVKEGETRIFEPYQHLFFVRVDLFSITEELKSQKINGGSVNIPEGYKVLTIENFNAYSPHSQTRGYDIWFTNEVPVEVTSIYNEELGAYDFSHFGLPVEEKENEETIQKVK